MHQGAWLVLFAVLVAIYTLLGLAGGAVLWIRKNFFARAALLLVALIIVSRLVLCSMLEAPEPRYVVEFFPLLSALGGLAIVEIVSRLAPRN